MRVSIKGHPVHAMIVGLPIAFYTTGVVALIIYAANRDPFWYRTSMIAMFAGVGTALVAGVFGMIDLFTGVPPETRPRTTGVNHFGLHLLAALLFAGAAFMMYSCRHPHPPAPHHLRVIAPLVIAAFGFAAMAVAAWLGWTMVQTYRVGVKSSTTS